MPFDLAIIGSGFGGSLLAMVACRLGLSVVLLERGSHPRFAIGESSSPLANLLLEEIAQEYVLPRLLPLTSWGSWQRTYPEIGCGLKRGFMFYHHQSGERFANRPDRSDQLLVAASPGDDVSDTHWFRADFDQFMVREAETLGVEYLDHVVMESIDQAAGPATLSGTRHGAALKLSARLVIDATGPRGFLHRALGLGDVPFTEYPPTQALYSHFTDASRCDAMEDYKSPESPPYPPDDAALHHVFEGGWMWVLRFNNGVTSAGVAVEDRLAAELRLADGEPAWRRVLERFPSMCEQFWSARSVQPFVYARRLPFRTSQAASDRWAMLPSAAAFVDPLFSTGIPLTLLGIRRLADILRDSWDSPDLGRRLQEYGRITLEEADWVARFIAACYGTMPTFALFSALSMFYFAAASFAEVAHRIDLPGRPERFLAMDHAGFSAGMSRCLNALTGGAGPLACDAARFEDQVAGAIECINVAGLCDDSRRNWYPVDLEDLVRSAGKLGKSAEQMRAILATAPWARA